MYVPTPSTTNRKSWNWASMNLKSQVLFFCKKSNFIQEMAQLK